MLRVPGAGPLSLFQSSTSYRSGEHDSSLSVLSHQTFILQYIKVGLPEVSNPWICELRNLQVIREIPDHATFRVKGVNTGLVSQTWGMSLFGPM